MFSVNQTRQWCQRIEQGTVFIVERIYHIRPPPPWSEPAQTLRLGCPLSAADKRAITQLAKTLNGARLSRLSA